MKKTLSVFAILNAIFLVWFIAISIIIGLDSTLGPWMSFDPNIPNFWMSGLNAFTGLSHLVTVGFSDPGLLLVSIFEIIALASAAILVIFLIVWIIRVIVAKRSSYLAIALLFILDFGVAFFVASNFCEFYQVQIQLGDGLGVTYLIMSLASAALSFICGIVIFVVGLVALNDKDSVKDLAPELLPLETLEDDDVQSDTINDLAENDKVVEPIEPEPVPAFLEEPAPELEPEPEPVEPEPVKEEPVPAPAPTLDAAQIAAMIRDIVRDEIARAELNKPAQEPEQQSPNNTNTNTSSTVTGATFGGPLIIQYFNTPMPNQDANTQQVVKQVAAPVPVAVPAEVKKEEPIKKEEPAPAIKSEEKVESIPEELEVVEMAIIPEPVVAPAPVLEKPEKVYERISFEERMLSADKEMKDNYNELKNEILSYGVNSRVSNAGDTFRLHRKTYIKLTIAGKSLKLYFALKPSDYKDSTLPIQDASDKEIYKDIPLVFKVKSQLSMRRAKQLIQDTMDKDSLEQGEIGKTNWVKALKIDLK
jgi:hypothetical protein